MSRVEEELDRFEAIGVKISKLPLPWLSTRSSSKDDDDDSAGVDSPDLKGWSSIRRNTILARQRDRAEKIEAAASALHALLNYGHALWWNEGAAKDPPDEIPDIEKAIAAVCTIMLLENFSDQREFPDVPRIHTMRAEFPGSMFLIKVGVALAHAREQAKHCVRYGELNTKMIRGRVHGRFKSHRKHLAKAKSAAQGCNYHGLASGRPSPLRRATTIDMDTYDVPAEDYDESLPCEEEKEEDLLAAWTGNVIEKARW